MPVVSADGIKDFSLSEDGKSATFSLTTKYTSDIVVTIPAECLNALRMAIELSTPATGTGIQAAAGDKSAADKQVGKLVVKVPKKWAAAADKQHGVVAVIFDHQTPAQFGFAMNSGGAKELADALVKQADVVAASSTAARLN
jgi:hypothetical protein